MRSYDEGSRRSEPRTLLRFVVFLYITAIWNVDAMAAGQIHVVRENLITGGEPKALVKTKDSGYVIISKGNRPREALATAVDSAGKVKWQYVKHSNNTTPTDTVEYSSLAVLADESIVICGYISVSTGGRVSVTGLITHLDASGNLISEKNVFPHGDSSFDLSLFNKCVSIKDRIVVVGRTTQAHVDESPSRYESFAWLAVLGADGGLQNEKLIASAQVGGLASSFLPTLVGDVIVTQEGPPSAATNESPVNTVLVRIGVTDASVDTKLISGSLLLVTPVVPGDTFHTIQLKRDGTTLSTWDLQLREVEKTSGAREAIIPKKAYRLADGSIVLFGSEFVEPNVRGASLKVLDSNLRVLAELTFQPHLSSSAIIDAVPTGKPGEFATIRHVFPKKQLFGNNETRSGIVLSFVQID